MIQVGDTKAYTVTEAAKLLDVTAQTIRSYIKDGKLKAQRAGNKYVITEKTLEDFLNGDKEK